MAGVFISPPLGEENICKTIYQLSTYKCIDSTYSWRIARWERDEVSREVLLLIDIAMVLDKSRVDQVIEMANRLLDAGGIRC
jgi:hypothetical protein